MECNLILLYFNILRNVKYGSRSMRNVFFFEAIFFSDFISLLIIILIEYIGGNLFLI